MMEAFFLVEHNLDINEKTSPATTTSTPSTVSTSRKGHKKSKLGCHNCKIRKVKCDENKPECRRCEIYGVRCVYDYELAPKKKPRKDDTALCTPLYGDISINTITITLINDQMARKSQGLRWTALPDLHFDSMSLETLRFFQDKTLHTLANNEKTLQIFKSHVVRLATSRPWLMYAILTMAMSHQRFLHQKELPQPTVRELMHYQEACSSFKTALSAEAHSPEDCDAVFLTSTLLGGISFTSLQTFNPEKSWPLTSNADDLMWLSGRRGVLSILYSFPAPQDSVLLNLAHQVHSLMNDQTVYKPGISGIPKSLVRLCNLDEDSTSDNNPYLVAVRLLLPILHVEPSDQSPILYLNFVSYMQSEFIDLLKRKDVPALILYVQWCALLSVIGEWWTFRRTRVECTSICIYLDRELQLSDWRRELLEFPAQHCGYRLRRKAMAPQRNKEDCEDKIEPILAPQSCTPM